MIIKHSIHNWLFYFLLILHLAGATTGCKSDQATIEEAQTQKNSLVLTARGVTVTEPTGDNNYDTYIKTLRIIGFDANENVICNKMHQGDELKVVDNGNAIEINQLLEESFSGGNCTFYFIANEEGYSIQPSGTLSQFLGTDIESAPTKEALSTCIISFDSPSQNKAPGSYPILMTASSTNAIKQGQNQIKTIHLIRCLAKMQLKVLKDDAYTNDIEVNNVKLQGTYPTSYSLFDTRDYKNYGTAPFSTELTNTDITTPFTGKTLYFPEMLVENATTDNNLRFSFSLTAEGVTDNYEINIGAGNSDEVTDYNIYRNHWFRTTVNFGGWQNLINIKYSVADWFKKDINLDFSHPTTVCEPIKENDYSTEVYYVNTSILQKKLDAAFGLKFTMSQPLNQKWTVTSEGGDFDIMVFNHEDKDITNSPEKWISGQLAFKIYVIPNRPLSEKATNETTLRISTLSWGGSNDLLLINENRLFNKTGSNQPLQTEIKITQVAEPEDTATQP
jgi:hypothetical protein